MIYSDIREVSPMSDYRTKSLADLLCMSMSPFFSIFFIHKKIRPNVITMLMIFFGCLGAILFALPCGVSKIVGFVCFYLWYIMDCSDGEVARKTKVFSTYGREMDYIAHLICHPLMNLALWMSYIQLGCYDEMWLTVIFIGFISFELINRNIIAWGAYLKMGEHDIDEPYRPGFFKYWLMQWTIYPNFILIFPLFFILDWFLGINSFYLLCTWFCIFGLSTLRGLQRYLVLFFRT